MTRTQRKVHVLLWLVLGPVVLIMFLLVVLARPTVPVQADGLPGVEPDSPALTPNNDAGRRDE